MVVIKKIFFALILVINVQCFSQTITAQASVDTTDYLVGDYIYYSLEIKYFKDLIVEQPLIRDTLNHLEIIKESEPVITEDDVHKTIKYNFTLSFYDSNDVAISPIVVKFKSAGSDSTEIILSNSVSFTVHTLEVDPQADIKDIKSPLTIPFDWTLIIIIAVIAVVIILASYFLYKRYKKKKAEQPVKQEIIKVPAYIRALQSLEELERQKLWQQGRVKDYHSDITGIIRNYFEERFKLPALELTTRESLDRLKLVRDAKQILEQTDKFLNNADLVKFAKFVPIASVNEEMMSQAKEIVNNTIPKESLRAEEVKNA
ncbi:MAG TPA: hypothetical protein VH917_03755 [Ignavibacteriaceae bacterium]